MAEKRRKQKEKKEKGIPFFDYNLLFIVIFLLCFGLVMLYSSSSYTSANRYNDSMHYLKLQIRNILLGMVAMAAMTAIDYRWWKKLGVTAYVVSFLLCILVFVPKIGSSSHGSSRWISVGPIQFQPSEVAKIAVILFMAMIIDKIPKQFTRFSSIIKMFIILAPLIGIVAYSNLSTAIIILGIAVILIFAASPRYGQFVIMAALGAGFMAIFLAMESYRLERLAIWQNPEKYEKGYQTLQGLYAIGSGGLFGKGLGKSIQKLGFVPEAQNDMIFSIICEELGYVGACVILFLFLILIWRFFVIATHAVDLFGALIAAGAMGHMMIQVILNIAVVTNTIPNTGITLPFISYGGTSAVFLLIEMGLVLSVSSLVK